MTKAYLVNHTHWDREWYFTACDALVLSDQLFMEVLDELEKNPKANFCLDGQSSIVDDFVDIHPECLDKIKQFVKEGRLFIGPWYTQTDALYVDGESILRNLMIGIQDTKKKYGAPMMCGYLPDTFGFTPQLPTYLQHAGIDNFLFWRGINYDLQVNSPYFVWQGLSEEKVYAVNFPYGYFMGLISNETKDELEGFVNERFDRAVELLSTTGNNSDVMIPSGADQKNVVRNIHDFVDEMNKVSKYETVVSSYPEFIQVLREKDDLPHYKGELRLPTYSRVHRTIGSVRTRFKLENFQLEQKILKRVEPLMIMARKHHIVIGQELLAKLWKKLFECQAHDSLGGCVSDNVAADIVHRFKEAHELADGIENTIVKKMADALNLQENEILVFNTDARKFEGEKEIHVVAPSKNIEFDDASDAVVIKERYYPVRPNVVKLVPKGVEMIDEPAYYELTVRANVEVPAFGYKIITFKECDTPLTEAVHKDGHSIQNDQYTITYADGAIELHTKAKTISNFIELVDAGNDGDTYDYSPVPNEKEEVVTYENASLEFSGDKQTLVINGKKALPYNLEDREAKKNTGYLAFTLRLTLSPNSELIEGHIELDNQIESHRLRMKINTDIKGEQSISHIQNGFVENTNTEVPSNWKELFVEKPVNINFLDKGVSVVNETSALHLYTKGLREYEKEDTNLYLTLMATTNELGKADLAWRPGRASGDTTNQGHIMMQTPMAQELGYNAYDFAIQINDHFDEAEAAQVSEKWLRQSITYQKQTLNVFINRLDNKIWPIENSHEIPREYSMMNLPESLHIAAIYPSYVDADAYCIRLLNPTKTAVIVDQDVLRAANVVNAIEEVIEFDGTIKPYDMITVTYKF